MSGSKPAKGTKHSQDFTSTSGLGIYRRRAERQRPFDLNNLVYFGDDRDARRENFRDPTIRRLGSQRKGPAKGPATAFNNARPLAEDPARNPYSVRSQNLGAAIQKAFASTAGPANGSKQAAAFPRSSAKERGRSLNQIKEASIETSQRHPSRGRPSLSREKPRTNFIRQNKVLANAGQRFREELEMATKGNATATAGQNVMKSVHVKGGLRPPGFRDEGGGQE